jgi:hypothetical protein
VPGVEEVPREEGVEEGREEEKEQNEMISATFWLDYNAAVGWQHKIGDTPVSYNRMITVRINDEWISGRYGSDDLSPGAPRPRALLYTAKRAEPLVIEEGCEASFVR